MCGITGFFLDGKKRSAGWDVGAAISHMTNTLQHRGPDERRTWKNEALGLAMGHTRLAILDLSAAASQPFLSDSGRQILVFNGEIYNFASIRQRLEGMGHIFRSKSDTEVLLRAFQQWGCQEALQYALGMFAFAFLDLDKDQMVLGRDRLGEKPLYYGYSQGAFLFGSELKSLAAFPGISLDIDPEATASFLRFGYVPAPQSIYKNIYKLLPAHMLTIDLINRKENIVPYWSMEQSALAGLSNPLAGPQVAIEDQLHGVLTEVIREQMISDVPLGAFLSGGIDSSLVVALMQSVSARQVQTFTIGFEQDEFNEARHAAQVAKHLGTNHTEIYVGPSDAMRVIERLPEVYDEPFADSSQIPTFIVAELARTQVKVCLTGDGGDEMFAGYNRHFLGSTLWHTLKKIPFPLRATLAELITLFPTTWRNQILLGVEGAFPKGALPKHLKDKFEKLLLCLRSKDHESLYLALLSQVQDPTSYLVNKPSSLSNSAFKLRGASSALLREDTLFSMQYLDSIFYLPEDILTKVDRATMAVGLESRAPFLDKRTLDFAWRLPPSLRVQNRTGKWILRSLLDRYVPRSMVDRPKSGFAIPINHWLKGSMRSWAESLINSDAIRSVGVFEPSAVARLWENYLKGNENSQYQVWNILMFQAWHMSSRQSLVAVRTMAPAAAPFVEGGSLEIG